MGELFTKAIVAEIAPRHTDHLQRIGPSAIGKEPRQCGHELAPRQISTRTEDDDLVGSRHGTKLAGFASGRFA